MFFYKTKNEEYSALIEFQSEEELEILKNKNNNEKFNFIEIKENILTTIADSNSLEELNRNFILIRQRLNYVRNIINKIDSKDEFVLFNLAKKTYNAIYNKLNNIN